MKRKRGREKKREREKIKLERERENFLLRSKKLKDNFHPGILQPTFKRKWQLLEKGIRVGDFKTLDCHQAKGGSKKVR